MGDLMDIVRLLGPFVTVESTPQHVKDKAADGIMLCLDLIEKQLMDWRKRASDIQVVQKF